MQEPNWDQISDQYSRQPRKDDIVWVAKKTRGRFPDSMTVAIPDDHGIVISTWVSSMGSQKLCILTRDLREVGTTSTCVKIFMTLGAVRERQVEGPREGPVEDEWSSVKLAWMEETYFPVIFSRALSAPRHRLVYPYVMSRDKTATLVSPLNAPSVKIWINREKVHPDDWDAMMKSKEKCHSVRVPEWLAKKSGVFGKPVQ